MKKEIFGVVILIAVLCSAFSFYQVQEESLVLNVEVPVRIFDGNTFVDNLTIDDFELYEDSKLQDIAAVYLVKKKSVERKEERKRFAPKTSRSFYLWFEMSEYMPKLGEAIDYFFKNVFFPGDSLVFITPLKAYNLKSEAVEMRSEKNIANQLKGIIRRDITIGNSEYRAALKDLQEIVRLIETKVGGEEDTSRQIEEVTSSAFAASSIEEAVAMYSSVMSKLENIRDINQQKLLDFAKFLKNKEGQKQIFLFYQREFLPQIRPNTLSKFISGYQDKPALLFTMSDLFQSYKRDIVIDVEKLNQAFADSSLSIHFLYIKKPADLKPGLEMQERSEDIFLAFKEMAQATGGLTESTANPAFAFKRAIEASEQYYLLYYMPKNYRKDGKFKKIKVRVKNKKFSVSHRAGYFAN